MAGFLYLGGFANTQAADAPSLYVYDFVLTFCTDQSLIATDHGSSVRLALELPCRIYIVSSSTTFKTIATVPYLWPAIETAEHIEPGVGERDLLQPGILN